MNEFKQEAIDELVKESEETLANLRKSLTNQKVRLEKCNIKFEMKDLYEDAGIAQMYDSDVKIFKRNIEKIYNDIAKEEVIIEKLKSIK